VGNVNLNLKLVEIGAATPYFYQGEKGKYAKQLLKAAQNAKAKKIGLWKMCPNTKLDPSKPATTGSASHPRLYLRRHHLVPSATLTIRVAYRHIPQI
jgi:hypothetical protein